MPLFGPPNIEKMKAKRDVQGLIKALSYKKDSTEGEHFRVRRTAAKALGEIGDPLAVEPLISVLKDKSNYVREATAVALEVLGDPRAVEPLIATLQDSDGKVRESSAKALGKIGDARVVAPFISVLKNENSKAIRMIAMEKLGQMRDARAVEPLIAMLKDRESGLCDLAVKVLGEIGAPATEAILAELKNKNSDANVRKKMVEALDGIGWQPGLDETSAWYWVEKEDYSKCAAIGAQAVGPLISSLESDNKIVPVFAARALKEIGTSAAEPLIAALQKGGSQASRQLIIEVLGTLGDVRAIDPLVALFGDANLCLPAIRALGDIGGDRCIESLVAMLQNGEAPIRLEAAESLSKIGWQPGNDANAVRYWIEKRQWDKCADLGDIAVEPLIAILRSGDWSGRAAANALVTIGAPAVEPLLSLLSDEHTFVRQTAVETLGKLGDARAVEPLIALLNDWDLCLTAAEALGRLGDARALVPLIDALKDKSMALNAAEALDLLGWKPGNDENGAYYWYAKKELDQCATIGAPAVKVLILALQDVDVRRIAVATLINIGAPAFEQLVATLADDDWLVRCAIVEILGKMGDTRAVPSLISALSDTNVDVRKLAVEALAIIGDARSIEPLIAALGDSNLIQRKSVASALVKMYQSGKLNEPDKAKILEYRNGIITSHTDRQERENHSDRSYGDHTDIDVSGKGCYGMHDDSGSYEVHTDRYIHNDFGIGVDFPL
jgi:HEAT repeat protein